MKKFRRRRTANHYSRKLRPKKFTKAVFFAEDSMDAKRLAKAEDMAWFIWELVHNGWRDFKHTDYDYHIAWDKIHELLNEHNIDIDGLTQ